MDIITLEIGLAAWTALCLIHIILSWIGARKLLQLNIDTGVKIIWLLAIFFIPFVGIATFFIMLSRKQIQ